MYTYNCIYKRFASIDVQNISKRNMVGGIIPTMLLNYWWFSSMEHPGWKKWCWTTKITKIKTCTKTSIPSSDTWLHASSRIVWKKCIPLKDRIEKKKHEEDGSWLQILNSKYGTMTTGFAPKIPSIPTVGWFRVLATNWWDHHLFFLGLCFGASVNQLQDGV